MDGGVTNAEGGESLEIFRRSDGLWKIAALSAWSFVFFISFLLNAILVFIFIKRSSLRTISNRFVMNLTVSNLITVIILSLLVLFDRPGQLTTSRTAACSLAEGSTALVTASSIFSVLLIAIDQYLAVLDPLHYRSRISNFKCGILIITMWTLSVILSLLAALNPHPRGIWLLCTNDDYILLPSNSTFNVSINSTITPQTENGFYEPKKSFSFLKKVQSNLYSSGDSDNKTFVSVWYGFIYNLIFGLFIYMIPFISICWIYTQIYFAARKNSERTRRTGSKPGLSSASFTEDYCLIQRDQYSDEFQKTPKISNLISVGENLEKPLPSQTRQSSSPIVEESSSVIFTVGSHQELHSNDTEVTENKILNTSHAPQGFYYKHKKECSKIYMDIEENRQRLLCENNEFSSPSQQKVYFNSTNSCPIIARDLDSNTPHKIGSLSQIDNKSSPVLFTVGFHQQLYFNHAQHLTTSSVPTFQTDFFEEQRIAHCSIENQCSDVFNQEIKSIQDDASVDMTQKLRYNCNSASHENEKKKFFGQFKNDLQIFSKPLKNQETSPKRFLKEDCKLRDDRNCADFQDGYHGYLETSIYPPIVTITPPSKTTLLRVASTRSTSSYINFMKHRISNGSLFKYREESRAARISAGVIIMGFICWTPYVIISGLRNCVFKIGINFPRQLDILVIALIVLATYISPLLFGYRSRRIKRELRKMFCFRKEISYKNNRSLMAKKVLKRRSIVNLSQSEIGNKFDALNCLYNKNKWPKEKVHFVQVPESALAVETCRSSFSSGASTQISSTSTDIS